ncbi:MAG: glycoside hydrolase family 27 protein [Lachnospiraceae bacterium]|nr:glycoside hydrolase family 27 protein [Lachnospiraceae bacterium]
MDKNQFAKTPPMGWNSYDYYDTTVNEEQVKANADYMAKNLRRYGWEYIVVDIQWYAHKAGSRRAEHQYIPFETVEMDEYSRLLPDPERFPSSAGGAGFGPLADYVHRLGLKFGIHIMRGIPRIAAHLHTPILGSDLPASEAADPSSICGWNPDMYGVRNTEAGQAYYDSLIQLYASWGVDFIKCDDICNTNVYPTRPFSGKHEIEMLHRAIMKSGREIVLSLSPGPALIDKAWHYEKNANMWRITDDFWDNWDLLLNMFERCELWQNHVSQGCYPDCDMLPLGWLGKGFGQERYSNFTYEECRTMMTLWCIFGSPLMIGGELTKMSEPVLSLLTNPELLKLLDPAYRRRQVLRDRKQAVWSSCSPDGEVYVALFNLGDESGRVEIRLSELEPAYQPTALTELWSRETVTKSSVIGCEIAPHGCAVFRLEK